MYIFARRRGEVEDILGEGGVYCAWRGQGWRAGEGRNKTHNPSFDQIAQSKTFSHLDLITFSQSYIRQPNYPSEIFIRFWDGFVI